MPAGDGTRDADVSEQAPCCPICGEAMAAEPVYAIAVHVCPKHGLWAGEDELRAIRRRIQVKQQTLTTLGRDPSRPPPSDAPFFRTAPAPAAHANVQLVPEGERPCPVCGEPMATETWRGVALDACPGHGVWLDSGELLTLQRATRAREVRLQALRRQAGHQDEPQPSAFDLIKLTVDVLSCLWD